MFGGAGRDLSVSDCLLGSRTGTRVRLGRGARPPGPSGPRWPQGPARPCLWSVSLRPSCLRGPRGTAGANGWLGVGVDGALAWGSPPPRSTSWLWVLRRLQPWGRLKGCFPGALLWRVGVLGGTVPAAMCHRSFGQRWAFCVCRGVLTRCLSVVAAAEKTRERKKKRGLCLPDGEF